MQSITEIQQLDKMKTPLSLIDHTGGGYEEAAVYYVETLSECNLKCVMCGFGNREIFQRETGKMSLGLFKQIVDEIARRSPHALVAPYHHCEPLLHTELPEMVQVIKNHNLRCEISTNLNYAERLEELLKAEPGSIDISVSGFYQNTYEKNHVGGDIEKVKRNMELLRNLMEKTKCYPQVTVQYHMYINNLGEDFDLMRKFVENLGFTFSANWSRSICTEMSLKYLREIGNSRYHGETLQWFDDMPKLPKAYNNGIKRMIHLPQDYLQGEWENIQTKECLMNHRIINIRWNGKISLCSWTFDDRSSLGDYLTTPIERLWEERQKSPICHECLKNNYVFYTNYFDMDHIDEIARGRVSPEIASDRRFFAPKKQSD